MPDYNGSFMITLLSRLGFFGLALASQLTLAANTDRFPHGPDPELTPGELCNRPSERRYPEKIAYCQRDVDTHLKREIFRTYDRELGFETTKMNRGDFKIDHYIPLCMGGSNNETNLWPQHRSVYEVTDDMEHIGCEKMSEGRLKQEEAVELVRKGKNDLSQVPAIIDYLKSL